MEKQAKCRWCGHERCSDCQKDKWPELQDGCCQCRRRFVPATYEMPKDKIRGNKKNRLLSYVLPTEGVIKR